MAGAKEAANMLIQMAPALDQVTTLAERFDLLNVNVADRDEIDDTHNGIIELAAVYGLEDSASHRGEEGKNGALATAINAVMIDFLCKTPEGKAVGDKLFEPGGLLGDIPMYTERPDGTLRPKLRAVRGQKPDNPA